MAKCSCHMLCFVLPGFNQGTSVGDCRSSAPLYQHYPTASQNSLLTQQGSYAFPQSTPWPRAAGAAAQLVTCHRLTPRHFHQHTLIHCLGCCCLSAWPQVPSALLCAASIQRDRLGDLEEGDYCHKAHYELITGLWRRRQPGKSCRNSAGQAE